MMVFEVSNDHALSVKARPRCFADRRVGSLRKVFGDPDKIKTVDAPD